MEKQYWKSQGILSARKSGNPVGAFTPEIVQTIACNSLLR